MWLYVGVSNRTAVSVLRQYLQTVRHFDLQPQFIRSDRGNETVLAASTHHYLQKAFEPSLAIENCYIYGTSTLNQRIESWWGRLAEAFIYRLRVSES